MCESGTMTDRSAHGQCQLLAFFHLASSAESSHNADMGLRLNRLSLCALCVGLLTASASAHPDARTNARDRTVTVRLQKSDSPNKFRVRIEYRLEAHPE